MVSPPAVVPVGTGLKADAAGQLAALPLAAVSATDVTLAGNTMLPRALVAVPLILEKLTLS